jgi:hypothetical protein
MDEKGRFTKGDPRAGRPPGTPNRTSRDARELAQRLLTDAEYLDSLRLRLVEGKLGALEIELWKYAYGPPPAHPISHLDDFLEALNDRHPPAPE